MRAIFKFEILFCIVLLGCASTKHLKEEMKGPTTDLKPEQDFVTEDFIHSARTDDLSLNDPLWMSTMPETNAKPTAKLGDTLALAMEINGKSEMSSKAMTGNESEITETSGPGSAVANKIVENYLNSKNKEPGGHCLFVSKRRFEKAYKEVYGHSVYEDLPDRMATPYYTPKEVFDYLYVSASGTHEGWRSLPMAYRGKGNAGAIAYAGMGDLVDGTEIWTGKLRPGALMQVWKRRTDYNKVVYGVDDKDLDPFGHSFIFMGYVHDENQEIIGIKIADQGYQSYRSLLPNDYEVWWAVNLTI